MSGRKSGLTYLSLEAAKIPLGFISLASAVLAGLQDNGVCVLRTNEEGEILSSSPDEVAFVNPPVLIVDPASIIEYNENDGTILIKRDGCILIKKRIIVSDIEE